MTILEALRQVTTSIKTWVESNFLKKNELHYPVNSVNGKTGVVELSAADIGALSSDIEIPSIEGLATEVYVNEKLSAFEYTNATDDGTGIVTLGTFIKPIFTFGADATISDQVLSVSGTGFNTDIQNNVLFVSGSNANAVLENGVCIVRN